MTFLPHLALLANGGDGMPAPFHPVLVNFTAALIPVSFAFDFLAAWLGKESTAPRGRPSAREPSAPPISSTPRSRRLATRRCGCGVKLGRNVVVFRNVAEGTLLPISPKRVRATDTTATDFVAIL